MRIYLIIWNIKLIFTMLCKQQADQHWNETVQILHVTRQHSEQCIPPPCHTQNGTVSLPASSIRIIRASEVG